MRRQLAITPQANARNDSTSVGRNPKPRSRLPRERKCASVIQACCAFQTIGGIVQRTNIAISKYTPGRLNSRLSRGTSARTANTEINPNAFVYLERNPSPISRPVSGQCQERLGLFSNASQKVNIAAIQKKMDSA